VTFNAEKCDACGECLVICDALSIYILEFIDYDKCDVCGKCTDICRSSAFEIKFTWLIKEIILFRTHICSPPILPQK